MEHDLRGLRLRICGYRDLVLEKMAIGNSPSPIYPGDLRTTGTIRSAEYPASSTVPDIIAANQHATGEYISPTSTDQASSSHPLSGGVNAAVDRSSANHTPTSTSDNHTRSSSPASMYFE